MKCLAISGCIEESWHVNSTNFLNFSSYECEVCDTHKLAECWNFESVTYVWVSPFIGYPLAWHSLTQVWLFCLQAIHGILQFTKKSHDTAMSLDIHMS